MPLTRASFGRSRLITWSAVDLRCPCGLSAMNMAPVLTVRPLLPPMNEIACSTSGSSSTTSSSACCRCFIVAKETSCGASVKPLRTPVSCCGNSPLGTMM